MTKEQFEKERGYVYGHNVHETTVETDKVEAEDEESIFVRGIWQSKTNIIDVME